MSCYVIAFKHRLAAFSAADSTHMSLRAASIVLLLIAATAQAGIVLTIGSGSCPAAGIKLADLQAGVGLIPIGYPSLTRCVPWNTVYWQATCAQANSATVDINAYSSSDCSGNHVGSTKLPADGQTCTTRTFVGLNVQTGFVASCRSPMEWPAAVSTTAGLTVAASSSLSCSSLAANASTLFYASGASSSCPQPSVTCLASGEATISQCGVDMITLPAAPQGECKTAKILGTDRAYFDSCPQPPAPTPSGSSGFVTFLIVLVIILAIGGGVYVYKKYYANSADGDESEGLRSVLTEGINGSS